jgi:hypothetical protein
LRSVLSETTWVSLTPLQNERNGLLDQKPRMISSRKFKAIILWWPKLWTWRSQYISIRRRCDMYRPPTDLHMGNYGAKSRFQPFHNMQTCFAHFHGGWLYGSLIVSDRSDRTNWVMLRLKISAKLFAPPRKSWNISEFWPAF